MLLKFFHFITFSENSIGTATHFKHALKAFLKCVKFETKLSKFVDLVPHLTLCASIKWALFLRSALPHSHYKH